MKQSEEMTIDEFLAHCKDHSWHFTVSWVKRRMRQLEEEEAQCEPKSSKSPTAPRTGENS